ncbi:PAC2 family protein [Desulforhabdus amnigena]|uniref:PAC2 family protein n=1 Tax=Desulforhabdus amnigena TaxID=40218 RepID=A0A9W6L933_9BACT|nr:PAC2 family protein [Desulforhabdus amnigena]NLJ29861.1 PAC2 family protein [Deltaproteobacteria bacterium]GLI36268.1 hypothetical protein DAMNIGENAA_37010 [Desulforhabdus amnigena]
MEIHTIVDPIRIRRAVLGFSGWPDAGKTIQQTFSELNKVLPCRAAAEWDLDGFWHTESSRPLISVRHGQIKSMDWPTYRFSLCNSPDAEPILVGMGPEPTIHWRPFARKFIRTLKGWGCEEIILLGSVYDEVFHDEILLTGIVNDSQGYNQVQALGCRQIEYTGPGAIHAVLMEYASKSQMRALSIWSHFPSYLNAPHELLIARLLHAIGTILDVEFKTDHLSQIWERRQKEIEELIENELELRQAMETQKEPGFFQPPVQPSAKVIEIDEFLRRRRERRADKE